MHGQIVKIHSDFYYVNFENEIFECKVREILKKQKTKIFVGDFVEFKNGVIEKVLERKNYLPRPSVSNVNQIIIVSSIKEPELNFQQLNRYISFAKYYKIETKLCFNKNDLSVDDSILEKIFQIYEPLGYEIIFTSAKENYGVDNFMSILKGKVSVLCGNSGVGKSSLINAINPKLNLKTKSVSEKTERGTHTTRHCEIITIAEDLKIVDTPGFSNLKFNFILPNQVDELFEEIKQYKHLCKFSDCLHIRENGCAVLDNMEYINLSRYNSYLAFVEEAKEFKEKIKNYGTKTEDLTKQQNNKIMTKFSSKKRQSARNTNKQNIYKDIQNE